MTKPFTYCITHVPTGKRYYGVRVKKDCDPSDLWSVYFTSSKVIHDLIKEEGKDKFTVEVRRIFKTKEDAKLWEHKVLRRLKVTVNSNWLNKSTGGSTFRKGWSTLGMTGKKHSEETKQRMRQSKLDKINNDPDFATKLKTNSARKLTAEVRELAHIARNGSVHSEEAKDKIRISLQNHRNQYGTNKHSEETKQKIRATRLETNRRKKESTLAWMG